MSKLKAVVALLPERSVQNRARESVLRVHRACMGRWRWISQPPHVSLKQPFAFESLPALEQYFDSLAHRTRALRTRLGPVEVLPPPPQAAFSEIALFVYDGLPEPGWQGMTYKVLPLQPEPP